MVFYMNNVITSLIDAKHDVHENITDSHDERLTLQGGHNTSSRVIIPQDVHINDRPNKNSHSHLHMDINYLSKARGHIAK